LNELKRDRTVTHYLNVLEIMNKALKSRIKDFNKIKYPKDNSKRIIIATLSVNSGRTWGVTTAPKNKE
jgi:hypothetical protein